MTKLPYLSLPIIHPRSFTILNHGAIKVQPKGFTLIELLVVISIIAIIAVVGIAIFQGQQRSARDARRRADVEAIAQALEAQKPGTATTYPALAATFFSSGVVPVDPTNTDVASPDGACPGVCNYCLKAGAAAACVAADTNIAAGTPVAGATWRICTNLETGGFFCRGNAQ